MSTILSSLRRAGTQPAFIAAAVVLLIAAVGLNAATTFLKVYFRKVPVDLARPLEQIPADLGHWVQVSKDQPLSHDIEEVLKTKNYLFREYVSTRVAGTAILHRFADKSWDERQREARRLQLEKPEAVINVGMTYYTGLVDTVAHIPDRCFVADGYQPLEYETPTWLIGSGDEGEPTNLEVRFINFEDQTTRGMVTRSVAYFFHVNGRYESSPLAVRRSLQNLFRKHGYYLKIELMTTLKDREKSAQVMQDFLAVAVPEIGKCLPDWEALEGRDVK